MRLSPRCWSWSCMMPTSTSVSGRGVKSFSPWSGCINIGAHSISSYAMASGHTARTPIRALASTGSGFEFLPPLRMHCDSHSPSRSAAPGRLPLLAFGAVLSPPASSGSGLMISMLQLVVEVLADGGQHDLHLAAGRLPAPGAKFDGACARLVALAADAQVAGTGDLEVRDR